MRLLSNLQIELRVCEGFAAVRLETLSLLCLTLQIKPGCFTGFTRDALILCLSASHLSASESSVLEAVIHWGRQQLASAGWCLSYALQQPGMLSPQWPVLH